MMRFAGWNVKECVSRVRYDFDKERYLFHFVSVCLKGRTHRAAVVFFSMGPF